MQTLAEESWDAAPLDCACLQEVLPALRLAYADMLPQADINEVPPRKVAFALGIPANTGRVRLHRARRALKRALLQRCGGCAEHGWLYCDFSRDSTVLPVDLTGQFGQSSL